jgi:hypothetical protein
MLNILRPKDSQRLSTNKLSPGGRKTPEPATAEAAVIVSRPLEHARGIHVTVDADGNFVGVPEDWKNDLAAVFSLNKIDKTPENLDKAAKVAQTSFKLRLKNRFPKAMRLEEEGTALAAAPGEPQEGPRVPKNMPVSEVMAEIRALCRTGSISKYYKMVGTYSLQYFALIILLFISDRD